MIGKLIGKVAGEVIALPWTVGKELVDAATETTKQAEKAVDRAVEPKDDKP